MINTHLHIVTLDTPWPVNYGGVIDLFYKIKTLHNHGVQIHLHCFCKEELQQAELNKYCVEVNYYKRKASFSLTIPYIVNSRNSDVLLQNLSKDNYPILLEGIHCTYHLFKNNLQGRKVLVRLHNVEFEYYKQLAKNETNWFKKWYYLYESKLLKKYEAQLATKANFIAVSEQDVKLYQKHFKATDIQFLPVFIEHSQVITTIEKGSFCLYHGNLSINENVEAVKWLLTNVFSTLKIPFVVAGKNPSKALINFVHQNENACIVENPSSNDLHDLISKAQINILPSLNSTGVKLKIINALYLGKHCITNHAGIAGSGLQQFCNIGDNAVELIEKINSLYNTPISLTEVEERKNGLQKLHNNIENANKLLNYLK